jgi:hypothetical protein
VGRFKHSVHRKQAERQNALIDSFAAVWNGWGGWTRTNTVLINSEVPYQLDHAPVRVHITIQRKGLLKIDGFPLNLLDRAGASFGASWTV